MTNSKRKRQKKKADITITPKGDKSGVDVNYAGAVQKIETIVDEEPTIPKQPFTDPTQEEPLDIPCVTNDTLYDLVGKLPEVQIKEAIAMLPAPILAPTQRQYGEEFLPEYVKARAKLRRLAGL